MEAVAIQKVDYTRYRWVVLAASCFVNLCIGSLYAWSVFAAPMAEHLSVLTGAPVGSLAIVFTVANAVGPLTMISGGVINDRVGPRWVILVGGALFGLGMIVSGFSTSVFILAVAYGLGCGLGMGMVYGATVSNAVKFFPDHPGFVGGIATASYGIGSVVVPPLANALIAGFDVTFAFKAIGVGILIVICSMTFLIDACPKGFMPAGWMSIPRAGREQAPAVQDKDWHGMLKDPSFYLMAAMLCCGAFSGLMVTSQASSIAQGMVGMDAGQAALSVSILALANTFGRVVAGFASDKLGLVHTVVAVFALLMAGATLLFASGPMLAGLFFAGICVVGFCFGSIMGIYPGFTAAQFGSKNNSVNYGIMFIGFALAGVLGPTIMNVLHEVLGSYRPAFVVAAVLGLLGIVLARFYGTRVVRARGR